MDLDLFQPTTPSPSPETAQVSSCPPTPKQHSQHSQLKPRRRADPQDPLRAVLPLPLHTTALIPSELHAIFGALLKIEFTSLPPVVPEFAPSVDAVREEYARRTRGDLAEIDEEKEDEDEDEDKSEKKGEEAEVKEDKGGEFDPDTLYVAIGCADSTVVYYKLSRGIRKPHDVPDE